MIGRVVSWLLNLAGNTVGWLVGWLAEHVGTLPVRVGALSIAYVRAKELEVDYLVFN